MTCPFYNVFTHGMIYLTSYKCNLLKTELLVLVILVKQLCCSNGKGQVKILQILSSGVWKIVILSETRFSEIFIDDIIKIQRKMSEKRPHWLYTENVWKVAWIHFTHIYKEVHLIVCNELRKSKIE